MDGPNALQSVQFVTVRGRRLAVLNAEDWEALIEWLESLEDAQVVRRALAALKDASGDRAHAGWLSWDAVSSGLE